VVKKAFENEFNSVLLFTLYNIDEILRAL